MRIFLSCITVRSNRATNIDSFEFRWFHTWFCRLSFWSKVNNITALNNNSIWISLHWCPLSRTLGIRAMTFRNLLIKLWKLAFNYWCDWVGVMMCYYSKRCQWWRNQVRPLLWSQFLAMSFQLGIHSITLRHLYLMW